MSSLWMLNTRVDRVQNKPRRSHTFKMTSTSRKSHSFQVLNTILIKAYAGATADSPRFGKAAQSAGMLASALGWNDTSCKAAYQSNTGNCQGKKRLLTT